MENISVSKRSICLKNDRSDWKRHLDSHHSLICEFEEFLEPFDPLFADRFLGMLRFRCFEVAGPKSSLEQLQVNFQPPDRFNIEVAFKNSDKIISEEHTFTVSDILAWSISTEPLLTTKRLKISLLLPSYEPEIINIIKEPEVWKMRGERYSPLANIHSLYRSNYDEAPWYKYHFALQMRQSKKPIGFISFYQISQPSLVTPLISQIPYKSVMLSYGLSKQYWGQGLMSESLSVFVPLFVASQNVRELVGFADINNQGSRRILQKLGLQEYELLPNANISADLKDRYKFIIYKKKYV